MSELFELHTFNKNKIGLYIQKIIPLPPLEWFIFGLQTQDLLQAFKL